MALWGTAALAVFTSLAPPQHDWHSREHLAERMGVPGFLRGRRAVRADGGAEAFVLYEARHLATFSSPAYMQLLNHPSPWTTRVMGDLPQVSRTACDIVASHGCGVGADLLTVELSCHPDADADTALAHGMRQTLAALCALPGITGGHYLRGRRPADATRTQEARLRPVEDRGVDALLVLEGYDPQALMRGCEDHLSAVRLREHGAAAVADPLRWRLAHCMAPADLATGALS